MDSRPCETSKTDLFSGIVVNMFKAVICFRKKHICRIIGRILIKYRSKGDFLLCEIFELHLAIL